MTRSSPPISPDVSIGKLRRLVGVNCEAFRDYEIPSGSKPVVRIGSPLGYCMQPIYLIRMQLRSG